MKNKTRHHKPSQPSMSPLLRSLAYSRSAHDPVTDAMLLQGYLALDAFCRGHGSQALFGTLARYLLIAEELARLGHAAEHAGAIQAAHHAMVTLDAAGRDSIAWHIGESEYATLSTALAILDAQLEAASLSDVARAESRMVEALMRTGHVRADEAAAVH